jgi:hypothetical protein
MIRQQAQNVFLLSVAVDARQMLPELALDQRDGLVAATRVTHRLC